MLTGDAAYLGPHDAAVRALPAEIERLRALTTEDVDEQQRVVRDVSALIDRKIQELRATIAAYERGDVGRAMAIVRTGEGARLMDGIRSALSQVITRQRDALAQQQRSAAAKMRASRDLTIGGLVLAIVATSIAAALALRAVATQHRARARRAEEAARSESRRRVAAIVDSSDDAIVSTDLEGVISSWNPAAERIFGYGAEEAMGRPITLILPPERAGDEADVLERVRRGERLDHFETVRRTKDGRLLEVVVSISPVRDAHGYVVGASRLTRDVSEQRQTQQALRHSEATALAFFESAAEGILIVDEAGEILLANRQIEAMFGYTQDELLGHSMEMLLPESLRERHVRHRASYAADPRVRSMGRALNLAGRRRDGSEVPVEISLSYVRAPEGLRVMAFVTDITERLTLDRAAREAEKLAALGTLSAGIAHELNNPLGIISSRIELMLLESEDEQAGATAREDLGVIHRQVQRLARLVQGLLSYARPSEHEHRPVDLNHVVEETMLLAEKQLVKKGIKTSITLDRRLPRILGQLNSLEQVVLNLVTNAEQAIDGPGDLRITTRPVANEPGWIELIVADTGRGIPADQLAKIFDPFFTTKSAGTGLGLSISRRIVADHGGRIQIHSRPAEGTEFVLRFPVMPAGS
jgi:PAS domain S-box-containing protein